jgi:L-threonylcarbamoyladenylate synthase
MRPLFWGEQKTIDCLELLLSKGGVILAEGDTVLGLLADVSRNGFERLNQIKTRTEKPYLLLVHDYKKALDLVEIAENKLLQTEKLMNNCWPGPVTLIFNAKQGLAHYMKAANGTIAVRVPDHAGLLQLLERFDALFSTSANLSGKPVPHALGQAEEAIVSSVDCVVVNDEHQKQQSSAVASTIIDCTGDRLVVVRQGAFSLEALAAFFD